MRISELFDELDEHEQNELLDLPVRGTAAVSVRRVRRRVNRALDADPAERRVHMKRAYKKGICAALIAACLSILAYGSLAYFCSPGHLPLQPNSTCCAAGWMRTASANWWSTPTSSRSRRRISG